MFGRNDLRVHSSHMHGDIARQLFRAALQGHQYSDTIIAMDIATDDSVFCGVGHHATHADVLANFLHQPLTSGFDITLCEHAYIVNPLLISLTHDAADEIQEVVVSRDEVRLAIHLYHCSEAAIVCSLNRHHTISCGPTGFLGRLHSAGLAKCLNRHVDIATRLRERFFALHQAQSGPLAQFLNQCRRHVFSS